MFLQYDTALPEPQTIAEESQWWAEQLQTYLAPYRQRWDAYLDRRVVGNLTATVAGIVQTRTPETSSELGSTLCGVAHTEAGTHRLHRALHHQGWQAQVIEALLWEEAEQRRQELANQGETPLCIWDSSVLEKGDQRETGRIGSRAFQSRTSVSPQPEGSVQSACWDGGRVCAALNGRACCW